MNWVGPTLLTVSLILQFYSMLIFYVFPFTDILGINWDKDFNEPSPLHIALFIIYFILFFLAVWSLIVAGCSDPGFVSKNKRSYEQEWMSKRDQTLIDFLEKFGITNNLAQT